MLRCKRGGQPCALEEIGTGCKSYPSRIPSTVANRVEEAGDRPETTERGCIYWVLQSNDECAGDDLWQPLQRVLVGAWRGFELFIYHCVEVKV